MKVKMKVPIIGERTTLWQNIRNRVRFIIAQNQKQGMVIGDSVAVARAVTEEMERLHQRLDELEERLPKIKVVN